ncbi:hypothetical protein CROQUDRAFT_133256 [Cronartium quercuum f. sp. fusiforme G11]|uniref:Uncharacterized protein n=1 Tax=Cronartium quercuum f. sp. fusiforme G11 TaxID=708437 RepID=A0A9P6NMN5_9BASI|nr:hypothetical protein CROQUDRAFT_133256 [Cronartium quercuum f. sp. fusiforme G11]
MTTNTKAQLDGKLVAWIDRDIIKPFCIVKVNTPLFGMYCPTPQMDQQFPHMMRAKNGSGSSAGALEPQSSAFARVDVYKIKILGLEKYNSESKNTNEKEDYKLAKGNDTDLHLQETKGKLTYQGQQPETAATKIQKKEATHWQIADDTQAESKVSPLWALQWMTDQLKHRSGLIEIGSYTRILETRGGVGVRKMQGSLMMEQLAGPWFTQTLGRAQTAPQPFQAYHMTIQSFPKRPPLRKGRNPSLI